MKIIAYYLPQFHEIPENNEMWGKGFTEWTNVRNAKPLFEGHMQPVEPLNGNYYNLLDVNVMRWQAKIAKEYGVYGFCFYHYWYNGHKLLEKPIENFLSENDIDYPFCICWANHNWTTSWKDNDFRIIYQQDYSDRTDWKNHFDYLLPFFKDKRYIKNNGKPLVVIYEIARIPLMNEMIDYWQKMAKANGFPGIDFAFQCVTADTIVGFNTKRFSYDIEYQPQYLRELTYKKHIKLNNTLSYYKRKLFGFIKTPKVITNAVVSNAQNSTPIIVDYDEAWKKIISMRPMRKNSIPGAFVRMDTTPRMKNRGFITQGMTVDKFHMYLKKQIINCRENYKSNMMFMFAWNEWAEGGYLEPDKKDGYKVLEAIKSALIDTNELE
ncbi:hypothetical protein SAMN02910317_01313 [Ruminococcaceae bacterium FB2012]|nr:hypothetical protein SAMN02910317_01313 [Ruminococcaceae bacterium FB2012]